MTDFLFVLLSTALTAFCWGVYGPLMRSGTSGMQGSHLLPFICVGVAYFLIAVIVPGIILWTRGEKGRWTVMGSAWSLAAGAAGAIGALGIILALVFGGNPVYVMPLVFGGAPVVNTFTTMFMSKTYGEAKPTFYAGLILVVVGAAIVLMFKPEPIKAAAAPAAATATAEKTAEKPANAPAPSATHSIASDATHFIEVTLFTALTALTWGVYGPVLHRGQMKMGGSRLRPFTCVGIAYFLIAVIVPVVLLVAGFDHGHFEFGGAMWSLGGGAAGAIGALGIIMAFNFGGKPVFVMPLVFGCAPVINTLTTMLISKNQPPSPMFYAGLIVVLTGAVTVLVFAPKAPHAPAPKPKPEPKPAKAAAKS
jgi:hypothetical protein